MADTAVVDDLLDMDLAQFAVCCAIDRMMPIPIETLRLFPRTPPSSLLTILVVERAACSVQQKALPTGTPQAALCR